MVFTWNSAASQEQLTLIHKSKPQKKKHLDLTRAYDIKTVDTVFYYKTIVAVTDSSLAITDWKKTNRDTVYYYPYKDSIRAEKRPVYVEDTLYIRFSNIQWIKKDWLKKRDWLTPFGMMMLGAAGGVILLPVAAIDEGKEGVKNWAIFEALLLGISLPPIFIGTRKTKYNLVKKWEIRAE